MTVYVYRLPGQIPAGARAMTPPPWFSLTADTEEELHPLAEMIGLYRHFYRPAPAGPPGPPAVGHYDVNEAERLRAMALGAQPISARRWARMKQQRARGEQGPGGQRQFRG
jgi:Protein of unknown function (DUF4031)